MTLPSFSPGEDPGPSFSALLAKIGQHHGLDVTASTEGLDIPHGTTVVAARFSGGVVIDCDRRATSLNLISNRTMRKVIGAERWSAVAIAGAAGPALDMVKMFQLQLQHYEKVEGRALSIEGKANQLSQMLKANLPAAMQGLVVVPIFAGYDRRRGFGRLYAYDVTGGRYEEAAYVASGSGSLFARTVIKLGHDVTMGETDAIDLLIRALFNAADEDSATGGPDAMRGVYPTVAVITAEGYRDVPDEDVAARFEALIGSLARTEPGHDPAPEAHPGDEEDPA
ncbi:MAG: proteasome subunit beta [Acidimicrobiales bacterium]